MGWSQLDAVAERGIRPALPGGGERDGPGHARGPVHPAERLAHGERRDRAFPLARKRLRRLEPAARHRPQRLGFGLLEHRPLVPGNLASVQREARARNRVCPRKPPATFSSSLRSCGGGDRQDAPNNEGSQRYPRACPSDEFTPTIVDIAHVTTAEVSQAEFVEMLGGRIQVDPGSGSLTNVPAAIPKRLARSDEIVVDSVAVEITGIGVIPHGDSDLVVAGPATR